MEAIAPRLTVSNTEKGWKGDFLILFLLTASFKNELSKCALWPTNIALLHSYLLRALLMILNKSANASFSVIAVLRGWFRFIFVNSRDSFSTIRPSKGSI